MHEIICGLSEILENERNTGKLKMGLLKGEESRFADQREISDTGRDSRIDDLKMNFKNYKCSSLMVGWSSGTDPHDHSRQREHGCRGRHYAVLSSVQ